ncbi:MAG: hypothetical protein KatS3mg023_0478 [Armatimonadota bacterium]|nr:MAG: hypothetical protein KatS3mg023_0478 [Armatimonadota bacterium]
MPVIEITTPRGRTVRIEVDRIPSAADIDHIAAEIDRQYDAQQKPAPQPAPAQPRKRGLLERAVHWFMNTPVGRWLSASTSPIAPGAPVARQVTQPSTPSSAKPVTDPVAEANRLVQAGMSRKEAAKRVAERLQAPPEPQATLGYFWKALTDPASLAAQPDEKRKEPPLFYRLLHLLNAPIYALSASSIERIPEPQRPQRFKGRDWASLYGEQPTAGTWLEAQYPALPAWLRAPAGLTLDYLASMLYTAGLGKTMKAAGEAGKAIPAVREASAAAQFNLLKLLHPTAAKTTERLARISESTTLPIQERLQILRHGLQSADELLSESTTLDKLMKAYWPQVSVIDPDLIDAAQLKQAQTHLLDWISRTLGSTAASNIEEALRQPNWGQRVESLKQAIQKFREYAEHGAGSQLGEDIDMAFAGEMDYLLPQYHVGLVEALRRLRQTSPSVWEKLMSHWKRSMTVLNLPEGAMRNFWGNFLAQFLAGQPVSLRSILFGKPMKELIDEAFAGGLTRKKDIGEFSQWADKAARIYSGADKLAAAILSRITGKPAGEFMISESFTLPETIDKLQRWGLIPFASWPAWIVPRLWAGLKSTPWRWATAGRAITSKDEQGEYKVEPSTLTYKIAPGKGISIEPLLPLSPYMLSSDRGEAPDVLVQWFLPSLWRDVVQALQGEGATPRALTWSPPLEAIQDASPDELRDIARKGAYIDAATTLINRLTPPALWNLLRLAMPSMFADHPTNRLTAEDYLLRLLGVPVRSVSPIGEDIWEQKDVARQIRMRATAAARRNLKQ